MKYTFPLETEIPAGPGVPSEVKVTTEHEEDGTFTTTIWELGSPIVNFDGETDEDVAVQRHQECVKNWGG